MTGLDLARAYWEESGRPMLEAEFPALLPHLAAGLVGEGSECLGFDDEFSRDHDFGPGFCLWLTEADFAAYGERLRAAYAALPGSCRGFPPRREGPRSGGRVGPMSTRSFYARFIGREQPPASLARWLYLPEEKLAAAVSGQVFYDGPGEFTAIRDSLAAYYPEDVRIKKIAARAAGMAQSGQYNYPRCMRRGDSTAAALALGEFLKHALSMLCLLNRQYAPYYKWVFRSLQGAKRVGEALPLLRELSGLGDQSPAWVNFPEGPFLNRRDRKSDLIEQVCALVAAELRAQGLSACTDDFLEAHTGEIMDRIRDPDLRSRHVLEG